MLVSGSYGKGWLAAMGNALADLGLGGAVSTLVLILVIVVIVAVILRVLGR
jgi:hypothetical protein